MANETEIHRMAQSKDVKERKKAADELRKNFEFFIDKDQATKDLLALTKDEDSYVRRYAAMNLGLALADVTDKDQATKDLLALMKDEDSGVRMYAASIIIKVFANVTDKNQATKDLLALMKDEDSDVVRNRVAKTFGSVFSYVTDKDQVWKDLLALMKDEDSGVRNRVAEILGSVFTYVTDKDQVWKDLLALTKDDDGYVRGIAYHSLGRAYLFKATEADDENFRKELEKALEFFEKSLKEYKFYNPAKFCLPFYRSFYTIAFKKDDAEEEVQKYLNDAKSVVGGSESKEKLLEAVENLSNALKEVQWARNFNEMKNDLKAYRRYCDRAVELLDSTEDKTPGAAKVIRRGLPVIDERIKQILAEIQGKVETLSKQTQGTPFADLGNELRRAGQNLLKIENPIVLDKELCKIHFGLSSLYDMIPEDKRGNIPELLKEAEEEEVVERRLNLINEVFSKIISRIRNINLTINLEGGDFVMNKKTIIGGSGIIAGGDINIHDVNAPLAIGENITQAQTLSAIPQTVIKGDLIMGDVFKNIQNATIINKANVIDSFNKIKKEHDEEVAKALLQIGEFIEKSCDVSAGILFDKFNEELNKPKAEKSTLRKIWEGIEKTLPSIVTISDIVAKLKPLF